MHLIFNDFCNTREILITSIINGCNTRSIAESDFKAIDKPNMYHNWNCSLSNWKVAYKD